MRNYCIAAVILCIGFSVVAPVHAATGINEQLSYQGRLLDSTGAIVPDGTYNLEFKIYQDGTGCVVSGSSPCGGTLKWTETRTSTNKVTLRNGYFSVQLGEVTTFGTSIDWNQSSLWLSVNVGGTGTPTWDGEMLPFRRIAAAAYALNAKQVGGLDVSQLVQLGPTSVQADASANSSIFVNKTNAVGNILQLQRGGTNVFSIANGGSTQINTTVDSITALTVSGTAAVNVLTADTFNNTVRLRTVNATNTSTFDAIWLQAPKNGVTAFFGGNDDTSAYLANESSADLRFNGTNVGWGDMGYYPTGGDSGEFGHFRFSTSGSAIGTTPNAKVGVGDLYVTNKVGIGAASAARQLEVYASSALVNAPALLIQQASTGDASLEFKTPAKSWYIGADTSNSSTLTINSSTASGGSDTFATPLLTLGDTGQLTLKNSTDSASAVLVQNVAGNNVLQVVTNATAASNYVGLGKASALTGQLTMYNSTNGNTASILSGVTSASYSLILPTSGPAVSQCLQTDSSVANQLKFASCSAGGASDLQTSYGADADGSNATIALTTADDSLVIQNPASNGTDSGFTMLVEQLNTGAVDALRIAGAGTGLLLKVTDSTTTAVDVLTIADEGAVTFKNRTDSTAAFTVQKTGTGVDLFQIDSTNSRVYIGDAVADATAVVLALDTKNTIGDPASSVDGAMYYNSDSKGFRCRHNTLWQDCDFASLRAEWVMQEDFSNTSTTSLSVGNNGWLFASIGTGGTITKTNVGTDASDRDRMGVIQMNSPATVTTGTHLRLDPTSITGVPGSMVVEFDFGPVNAAAAAGLQQVERIGLHDSSTTTAPADGIYFQHSTTTTSANWFRCTQTTCVDTGIARTTTANQYQRFRIQTNSAGTSVEFFINEVSGGVTSTNLPGATASYGPAINVHTVDATIRQWKMDYFQIKRNITTLR